MERRNSGLLWGQPGKRSGGIGNYTKEDYRQRGCSKVRGRGNIDERGGLAKEALMPAETGCAVEARDSKQESKEKEQHEWDPLTATHRCRLWPLHHHVSSVNHERTQS